MSARVVVVLDVPPTSAGEGRRLVETVQGVGVAFEEVDSLDAFAAALRAKRARVGLVAFEALWPDPQRTLRALRDKAPGARLIVAHADGSPRLRLGQRLWSVGLCDYLLARSIPPHEIAPVIRQAYADALIEASLDTGDADEDPAAARLYNRIAFLQKVNAALTNQRRVDGLVRELQMKLPHFMDYVVLEVLITGSTGEKLHVLPVAPVEHDVVWKLAEDLCTAVAPFSDRALAPEALEFIETAPSRPGTEGNEAPVSSGDVTTVTLPMVFCGELVGGIGLVVATEIGTEQRAILQLVAYQLATSVRNAQALEAAESASLVDELTGTSNRRYLKRALPAEWRRAERYRVPLAFAMVDIDHFKRINDVHGHLVGDAVLQGFASLLREQLRDTDHLVRYGGEEFLLILPETSVRDATLVLERIRLLLARTPVYTSEKVGSVQITISAGIAGYPICSASSGEELIHLADEALLAAKTSGRDRTCLASDRGFKTIGLEGDPHGEQRRFSRIRSQLPVRFVELPEFEARAFTMSTTDLSVGGIAVQGPGQPLKKNAYALVFLGDEQKPRLSQVMWTRDEGDQRAAGLQFVGAKEIETSLPLVEKRRALVIARDATTRGIIERIMSAAHYDVSVGDSHEALVSENLDAFSLLVIGESSLRGELGEMLQKHREQSARPLRIALINETLDRRAALETIRSQQADHLVPSGDSSQDTLFATLSKLLLEEYFGLKKYLLWGAETSAWTLSTSAEKRKVLDEIKAKALEVRCHPRITDLLVAAVDEMIINALYRPEPIEHGVGRSSRPVTVECGSDGRFLGVAVLDEHGVFCHDDLFRGIGKALEHEEKGIADDAAHAHLGFRIMLSTLSHLVINVDPGRCTEIIGLVDLRKSLKEYRTSVPSLGMFTTQTPNK